MAQTVGQRLTEARSKQGFSIEDVAHKTRIRPHTLRDIEADDYSGFPNLTYAKSFLNMYSDYLGVDVSDFTREFGPANAGKLETMPYLDAVTGMNGGVQSRVFAPARSNVSRSSSGGHPFLLILILLGAIGAAYGIYYVGKSTGGDEEDPPARTETAATTVTPADTSAPGADADADADANADVPYGPPSPAVTAPAVPTFTPRPPDGENGEPRIAKPVVLELEGESPSEDESSE